ncbi:MAG: M18 family aminopeptidase [Arcanobacterium sp.]|nr:M18 family aminopeptidase [Arcanobacterium sp.]
MIAWRVPEQIDHGAGVRIVGTHTDSPSFHLKPVPDTESFGYEQVNVEVYGGPLLNSWLNRDLGLAGRIVLLDGAELLVRTEAVMVIPQVAPHLDRSMNKELALSAQHDYHPIWSVSGGSIVDYLARTAAVSAERIAAMDVFAYDAQPPQIFGGRAGTDFIASGRQDNLSSVFPALAAFVGAEPSGDIQVFAALNNEEIGSRTYAGAAGGFLESILRRLIEHTCGAGNEIFERVIANSSCVSADAGHAVNPNRAELHDPAHRPLLGAGPLLKIHASGAYSSNALTQALLIRAAASADVAIQEFVSNNDVPCGSTIGPITATRLGIATVDCGIPLLSMHSVRELSAPSDLKDFAALLAAYWEM